MKNKVSLLITTYNRPEYFKQCLDSLLRADLSNLNTVMIVDDCSTDVRSSKLINDFNLIGIELIKAYSKENRSIKGSLLFGLDLLFKYHDIVINLDGDAIVRRDFISVLMSLKSRFPGHIITGFNCLTKNRDGSERHKVLETGDGYTKRRSVGGINMLFDKSQYQAWVRPTLIKAIEQNLNWDDHTCRASMADGKEIITTKPSVVQHIGIESSMGHSTGGEPPDVAEDFESDCPLYSCIEARRLRLPNVTLVSVDDNIDAIIKAADISCRDIEFGAVKLLSSADSKDSRAIKIRRIGSKKEYSQFILKELAAYIDTPFALIIQHDGYVLNHMAWTDEFLNYDMVGAVWDFRPEKRTANGGFSLRSKRMIDEITADSSIYLKNDHIISNFAEDHVLFYIYREYLEEKHGIRIAPESVCNQFSIESWGKKDKAYKGSFGFHGYGIDFSKSNLSHVPY